MSHSLAFSIILVFVILIEGNQGVSRRWEDDFQSKNSVEKDYIPVKDGTSEASTDDEIKASWIWEPLGNQKNKVEFESVVGLFDDDEQSGYESDQTEIGHKGDNERLIKQTKLIKVQNITEKKNNDTHKIMVEKTYLAHMKQLQKNNWCFKENGGNTSRHWKRFKKTSLCCRERIQCRVTSYMKNGINECSCDVKFYKCLKNTGTKMSSTIEQLYFSNKIVCYRKVLHKTCKKLPCNARYKWKTIKRLQ